MIDFILLGLSVLTMVIIYFVYINYRNKRRDDYSRSEGAVINDETINDGSNSGSGDSSLLPFTGGVDEIDNPNKFDEEKE